MTELLKECIRRVIWYFCEGALIDGQFEAAPGTVKFRFLNWLYGNGEPISDGWEYPNREGEP